MSVVILTWIIGGVIAAQNTSFISIFLTTEDNHSSHLYLFLTQHKRKIFNHT